MLIRYSAVSDRCHRCMIASCPSIMRHFSLFQPLRSNCGTMMTRYHCQQPSLKLNCYLKGSSLPWDKQRRFVSIRNANMTNTFIHRYKSNADLFSLHIQTHFWWGNSIWKVFLTVWIHVDRHTWWASKFLQSQNFLSGSLAWSSTSLHIKHSDVSVGEEERICLINNASQVKIHFLKEWPLQISTFIPQLISHCSIQHAVQLPRALDLDFVPSGSEAKWIWALKVIVAGWHFWQDNKHGAEVSDSKK